jgi:MerR family transcriptional regulator, aldehyde-responsive regulator
MTATHADKIADQNAELPLTPAEMAERTGVTLDTLRYYEREGLLDDVERAENGHRRYREGDVLWVEVLRCLRDTGMTIEQLRHYCELGKQGRHNDSERLRLLTEHRARVEEQIADRHEALRLIDHKIGLYRNATVVMSTAASAEGGWS